MASGHRETLRHQRLAAVQALTNPWAGGGGEGPGGGAAGPQLGERGGGGNAQTVSLPDTSPHSGSYQHLPLAEASPQGGPPRVGRSGAEQGAQWIWGCRQGMPGTPSLKSVVLLDTSLPTLEVFSSTVL